MKLKVTQENLAKALNSVARIANSRSTLPILSNVILKTVGTRVSIAATNLDIAITHFIGSKVTQEGAITVPARLTQDFVNSLPSGVIELVLEDYKLHINADKYTSVINGICAQFKHFYSSILSTLFSDISSLFLIIYTPFPQALLLKKLSK